MRPDKVCGSVLSHLGEFEMIRTGIVSAAAMLMALLVACSGNQAADDDDDDDGGEAGQSSGGTGGSAGGASGSGGTTGGTDGAGTGGSGVTGGSAGTDASGGTAGTDASGGTAGTDATGGTAGTGPSGGTGGTAPSESPPMILTFATSVTSIEPRQSVTFTAVVTDPDGIDNLIGGTLAAPGGTPSYGAFMTAAAEGSYSLALSWEQIQQATPLPDDSTEGMLTFEAKFFDAEGNSATQTVMVEFLCDVDGGSNVCCGGESTDTTSDDNHCGACNNACGEYFCYESECDI
jgi:hypothetical protein